MKAFTVKQPWASLVALGAKHFETRGWRTNYRGPLLITSSKTFELRLQELALTESFLEALQIDASNPSELNLPLGMALCVCDLTDVHTTDHIVETLANDPYWQTERQFGNYTAGRYAFRLDNMRPLKQPVPVRGACGLFDVPDQLISAFLP